MVFAPAFPAAGRTTIGGVQYVDGVPVSETLYANDPVHRARTSLLADLVPGSIGNVMILDAATQDALDSQVASFRSPEEVLWVGSPGLAQALARLVSSGTGAREGLTMHRQNILVVVGTANAKSHLQCEPLENLTDVTVLRAPQTCEERPDAVLAELAERAVCALHGGSFGALIATGGDTMEAILQKLGVCQFDILGELEDGFPFGRVDLAGGRSMLIALKAGGFGNANTLHRAAEQFRRGVGANELEQAR